MRNVDNLPFPNNLFAKWLKEWEEEARRRNSKTQWSYRKVNVSGRQPSPVSNEIGLSWRRFHSRPYHYFVPFPMDIGTLFFT